MVLSASIEKRFREESTHSILRSCVKILLLRWKMLCTRSAVPCVPIVSSLTMSLASTFFARNRKSPSRSGLGVPPEVGTTYYMVQSAELLKRYLASV